MLQMQLHQLLQPQEGCAGKSLDSIVTQIQKLQTSTLQKCPNRDVGEPIGAQVKVL